MLYLGSSSGPAYGLDEITIGIVVAKMGNPGPLSMKHGNFFTAEADSCVTDIATKEIIYTGQKPISLYKELIQVFSRPADWIFSGPTGIGMYVWNTYSHMWLVLSSSHVHIILLREHAYLCTSYLY